MPPIEPNGRNPRRKAWNLGESPVVVKTILGSHFGWQVNSLPILEPILVWAVQNGGLANPNPSSQEESHDKQTNKKLA